MGLVAIFSNNPTYTVPDVPVLDRCIRPNLKRAVTVISGDFEYLLAQCATGRSDHARIYLLSITEILEPNFFGYHMVIIRWSNDCPNFWGFWDCTESRLNECYQRQHWFKLNAVPYCTEFSCALSGTDWKSLILSRTTLNKAECCPGHRWANLSAVRTVYQYIIAQKIEPFEF